MFQSGIYSSYSSTLYEGDDSLLLIVSVWDLFKLLFCLYEAIPAKDAQGVSVWDLFKLLFCWELSKILMNN